MEDDFDFEGYGNGKRRKRGEPAGIAGEDVRLMFEGGMEVTAIAEELGVTVGAIYQWLRALGISSRERTPLERILSPEEIEMLVEEYNTRVDESVSSILARYGVTMAMWNTYMIRHKIPKRGVAGSRAYEIKTGIMDVAIAMYNAGAQLWRIEADTGVKAASLNKELHRRGIVLRTKRSRAVSNDLTESGYRDRSLLLASFVNGLISLSSEMDDASEEKVTFVRMVANKLLENFYRGSTIDVDVVD